MSTQFQLGCPTKEGWYNAVVQTADDTDHHITIAAYWHKERGWLVGEQYSKSPLKEYDLAESVRAYTEMPEYTPVCIPCDDDKLAEDNMQKRKCRARRRAITVGSMEQEDSALTFLKPLSGGYPEGSYIELYEDAYGNVNVSVKSLDEVVPPYGKVSIEDTALVQQYFEKK
jgi:hypothetical protein